MKMNRLGRKVSTNFCQFCVQRLTSKHSAVEHQHFTSQAYKPTNILRHLRHSRPRFPFYRHLPAFSVYSRHYVAFHRHLLTPPKYSKRILTIDNGLRFGNQVRLISIGGFLRGVLRIRYLVVGSAVGGGVVISQTIEEWKKYLPDFDALKGLFPEHETWESWKLSWRKLGKTVKQTARNITDFERAKQAIKDRLPNIDMTAVQKWFEDEIDKDPSLMAEVPDAGASIALLQPMSMILLSEGGSKTGSKTAKTKEEEIHEEYMDAQLRYQREVDRLEKENRDLRKQLLLKTSKTKHVRKMKKALIDMYSEVLDELESYDSSYNTHDNLPRVVVVGDQSAGKTSVLEMIAQARIFPRGSGQMMTRAPVTVTLSEGPYHIARFKDSHHEYDLTKESELEALRREVEKRMKASVPNGQTISSETISMTVKGPGLPRMVLVDLPGVISTVTTELASDTKERIQRLCIKHMENPNAIILCIQDGSIDAERSNVTNLVSSVDPSGKRTIFVLTKVDLAEQQMYNPHRIQKILEGKLFPMKALGYFAVVTGRGSSEDSIAVIKNYEEEFFKGSKLFKQGVMKPNQMTTHNLSHAVSECFWKMVRESVEQQADAFKATRFNLETEWKNTFPRVRELDREELFEKARSDILDEIINLSQITPHEWETAFTTKLWEKMSTHVIESIYLPASQTDNQGIFNTTVDIKLKQWADSQLPKKCVEVGMETLQEKFCKLLDKQKDDTFKLLKEAVKEESLKKHKWDSKAEESLRVLQINSLEDRTILDKNQWDIGVHFMDAALRERLAQEEKLMNELLGPMSYKEMWLYWQSQNDDQKLRKAVTSELQKLLNLKSPNRKPTLASDEVTTVRKNLESVGIVANNDYIKDTWHHVYRKHFLSNAIVKASDCKKGFFYYQKGFVDSDMVCHDVVLFWRIQRMLKVTSNALRQQVMNNEARRLERNIKDVLDELGDDRQRLEQLLTGKRVLLAEELKRVRHIQELLEEFIKSLNSEK